MPCRIQTSHWSEPRKTGYPVLQNIHQQGVIQYGDP